MPLSQPATITIGVLALQGGFQEHLDSLKRLSLSDHTFTLKLIEVRLPTDLAPLDGLIIPGGESTTISRLLKTSGLYQAILEKARFHNLCLWGTCAGAILLAQPTPATDLETLGLMDITVARNAFGRQADSFTTTLQAQPLKQPYTAVFIRAPIIERVGKKVKVLATLEGGHIVAAQQGRYLATAFHPELTADLSWHRYFLDGILETQK